jgi:hypothetical protein
MEQPTRRYAAGIDWAKDYHAICVLDAKGRRVFEGRFAHEEDGLVGLCRGW